MSKPYAPVRQAIFPVAGLGTRFLPVTKTVPKELLPIANRPLIDFSIAEAFEAGIERIIMVTGRNKQALEDYFDSHPELEQRLEADGKHELLNQVRTPIDVKGRISFIRQIETKGLGHAVARARDFLIPNEPVAILSPDDLVFHSQGCIAQMQEAYQKTGGNIVAVMDVPKQHTNRYGVLDTPNAQDELPIIHGLVEKPNPDEAPSTLSIIGRYVLQAEIFDILETLPAGAGGEIQLTDAIAGLIGKQPVHGFRFKGTRYDCGSIEGWHAANQAYLSL